MTTQELHDWYQDYYTFEVSRNDVFVKHVVLKEDSEDAAYQRAYKQTPDGCTLELIEIEPSI